MNPNPLKDFALAAVGAGWFVFPLVPRDKKPDGVLAPEGFKSASNDPVKIEEWWTASPNANIGIDLGSSNLCVLDFDQGPPPKELIPYLENTYTVKTARGFHFYFIGAVKQAKMHFQGQLIGDIKSIGGYVLGATSIHPSGAVYTAGPNNNILILPESLLEKVTGRDESVAKEKEFPTNEHGLIPHGYLHDWIVSQAGMLRNLGLGGDGLLTPLLQMTHKFCEPPIDENKVKQIAASMENYEPGTAPLYDLIPNQKPDSAKTPIDVTQWRTCFRTVGEMDNRPIDEIITGVLQEGICFIGANPGDGKTLTSLAFAKSICTGEPLFGLPQFKVDKPRHVIYLIPESRDAAFRKRCEDFRIPNGEMFLARTTSSGPSLRLGDPVLMEAIRQTNPVVFLDTAARFMESADENSAAQNRQLVNDVIALGAAGAVCVVLVHHATKASQQEQMTLENMLRGTSDLAAMCDQAYGIRKDRALYANGNGPMEIDLHSLKDREQIGSLTTLRLAASRANDSGAFPVSIIRETGNFRVVSDTESRGRESRSLVSIVSNDPAIPLKELAKMVNVSPYTVKATLTKAGWHTVRGGRTGASPWHQDAGGSCPYAKQVMPEIKPPSPLKKTVQDAVEFLSRLLAYTSPEGEYVREPQVYEAADKAGLADALIHKAKKRLGVVITKEGADKAWRLPTPADANIGEPVGTAV